MVKEIGSNFWLNRYEKLPDKDIDFGFLGINYSDMVLLSSGRMAIAFVLNQVRNQVRHKQALLPSYTCSTVIEPFIAAGFDVNFVDVNEQFQYDPREFAIAIDRYNPSVVLVHSYFGFNSLANLGSMAIDLRAKGVIVIEDITQTLYSGFQYLEADYYIASLRKWGPLPDGGVVISQTHELQNKPVHSNHELEEMWLQAFHKKYLYITKGLGSKQEFLRMFLAAESLFFSTKPFFRMCDTSRRLQANFDRGWVRKKRRHNFVSLLDGLRGSRIINPVYTSLPKDVTPLYFPIFVKGERTVLQQFLAKTNMYCPIIWLRSKAVKCTGSIVDMLYKRVITIPCDQRYGKKEMDKVCLRLAELENADEATGGRLLGRMDH